MKEWGFKGRLWTGRRSYREKNWVAEDILAVLPPIKSKTLVHDCDGFNHEVLGLLKVGGVMSREDIGEINAMKKDRWGFSFFASEIPQLLFTDGTFSCGCSAGVTAPRTREQIESYFGELDEAQIADLKKNGWWSPLAQFRFNAIKAGDHICDERGIVLDEFSEDFTRKEYIKD